jgi:hypothetical protein
MSEAPEKLFYVRARGRVSGPFNMPALSKMLRRGGFSRVDELSENQIEWVRAAQFPELFPSRTSAFVSGTGTRIQNQRSAALNDSTKNDDWAPDTRDEHAPARESADEKSPAEGPGTLYNYAQRGVMVGPVSESVLTSLVLNGTLRPDDAVWPIGSTNCVEARQLIFLATAFFESASLQRTGETDGLAKGTYSGGGTAVVREAMNRSNRRVSQYVLIAAICWVMVGLLCLHLPFGVTDSKIVGWWSFVQAADSPKLATGTVMIVAWHSLACIAIILVASLMHGLGRSIMLMCIGLALEIPLFVVAAINTTAGWTLFSASAIFFIPVAASGLAAILRARRTANSGAFASAWQGTFATATAFFTLMLLITIIVVLSTLPDTAKLAGVIGFIVGLVLLFLSLGSLLAGSVMGLVALKPTFSPAAHLIGAICLRAGLALLVAGLVIICFDAGQTVLIFADSVRGAQVGESLAWILIVGRLAVLFLFAPAIIGLGLEEFANALVVTPRLRQQSQSPR